jgi:hypothetical protein
MFPVAPTYKETTERNGPVSVVNHFYMAPVGPATFMVYYVDVPGRGGLGGDELLDALLAAGLAKARLTKRTEKALSAPRPGREYTASDGPTQALGRIWLAGDRCYLVSVIDDGGTLSSARAFLDSFVVE